MKGWEYEITEQYAYMTAAQMTAERGAHGWELVSVTERIEVGCMTFVQYTWKRPA